MHSDFSSSRLVRLLGESAPVEAPAPGMDFAERLSLWLNAFDAIALQGAQQAIRGIRAPAAPKAGAPRPANAAALAEDLARVRSVLTRAVGRALDPLATALPASAAPGVDPGYAPYLQRHGELQRQMDQLIAPLRDHVRQSLATASARLRQLAALDATMEHLLTPREQALLPTAAHLLERRFRQTSPEAFDREWRLALLAELDLRLEPVTGMVEALQHESEPQP